MDVSASIAEPEEGIQESGESAGVNEGVTGLVVADEDNIKILTFLPVAFIIFVVAAKFYVVRKRKKRGMV